MSVTPKNMTTCAEKPPVKTSVGNYFVANYPPFSCWKPDDIPDFLQTLAKPAPNGPLALYAHLPFCRQRCHYCYFRVYPRRNSDKVDAYIEAVLKELSLYLPQPALQDRPFRSVYFGGGSPSYLNAEEIRRLLGGLQRRADWDAVEECTFECEPGTITWAKLKALKESGVTRVSIGFQSLNDKILRHSGRDVTVKECLQAFHMARAAGFDEINIDLLAGLEGETTSTWLKTVEQVLKLAPECVTIYQFELPYNSTLYGSMKMGREIPLPSWPLKRRWVQQAFETFERAGYAIGSGYMAIRDPKKWRFVYTVEHFWHGADLLALGESAFGHFDGVHYQNVDAMESYLYLISKNQLPLRRALPLRPEEQLRREVILHLKTGALDGAYFRKKFGVELTRHFAAQFEQLTSLDFLKIDGDKIQLSREGLLQVDWLLPDFYLPEHVGVRYT